MAVPIKISYRKSLTFLPILLLLYYMSWAQVPINKFAYGTSSNSGTTYIDRSKTNKYFITQKGQDIKLKIDTLSYYIDIFKNAVKRASTSINPSLAYDDGVFIDTLQKRIKEFKNYRYTEIRQNYRENASEVNNPELNDLDSVINLLGTLKKTYYAVNSIYGAPKYSNWFFPGRNTIKTTMLYQRYNSNAVQVGTNIAFYGWENKGTINPEIVSFIAGPFRLALNTLISSTSQKDSTQELQENAKLRTLTGNGGNLAFSIYCPLFFYGNKHITTLIQASPKFVTEAPILGSPFSADTLFANINLGVDFNFTVFIPIFGGSSLYGYARPAYLIGTGPYLDALQTEKNFYLIQETVGIDIPKVGRIGFSLPPITDAKSLKSNTFLLSFMITPQNIIGN